MSKPRQEAVVFAQFDDFVAAVIHRMSEKNIKLGKQETISQLIKRFLEDEKNQDLINDLTKAFQSEIRATTLSLFGQVKQDVDLVMEVTPDVAPEQNVNNAGGSNQFKVHPLSNNDGMPANLPAWLVENAFKLHQQDSKENLDAKVLANRLLNRPEGPKPKLKAEHQFKYSFRPSGPRPGGM